MNNRIELLAEQSGMTQYVAAHNKYLERFAELIVKECASICELQSYTHSFTPAKARLAESTSNFCGLMIKRYFGVEE